MDKIQEFASWVKSMRDLQKQYFRDREPAVLHMARAQEVLVDRMCAEILTGQKDLLGGPDA